MEVSQAEYWDVPSSMMVHAYGYVKSRLTGTPPNPGENEKVVRREAGLSAAHSARIQRAQATSGEDGVFRPAAVVRRRDEFA